MSIVRWFVTIIVLLCSLVPANAVGKDGHWEPPGLQPTTATLSTVLAALATASGSPDATYSERVEHYRVSAGSAHFSAQMSVRGSDFRIVSIIDGATYASGRANGLRYRITPNNVWRIIESDVQGDDLDRWPRGYVPWSVADCRMAGEVAGAHRQWVIEYAAPEDVPHWFYIDSVTGMLVREVSREGSRTVHWQFADFRRTGGVLRPFAWHVDGAGGSEDVIVDDVTLRAVDASAISRVDARVLDKTVPIHGKGSIVAHFGGRTADLDVSINGHRASFVLDSGTTQVIVSPELARKAGITSTLGHGFADLVISGVNMHHVAVLVVPLFPGLDALMGYEFFLGTIVHVDYLRHEIDVQPRDTFVPPAGAHLLVASFDEGLPLIGTAVEKLHGDRFAIDTGSSQFMLLRYFFEHHGYLRADAGVGAHIGFGQPTQFLEGSIDVAPVRYPEITMSDFRFVDQPGQIEVQSSRDAVDFPIDGIIGTDVLARFEWWFDADGGRVWLRPKT